MRNINIIEDIDMERRWKIIRDEFKELIYNERIDIWKLRQSGLIVNSEIYFIDFQTREWSKQEVIIEEPWKV